MRDLKRWLQAVDAIEFRPGIWDDATHRSLDPVPTDGVGPGPFRSHGSRAAAIVVAFVVFGAAGAMTWRAFLSSGDDRQGEPTVTPPAVDNPLARLPDGWSELAPPPDARTAAVVAWTGSELLMWGGYVYDPDVPSGGETLLDDGYIFDPVSGESTPLPPAPLSARMSAAWAWTGSELLVWGGWDGVGTFFDDGAIFDPETNAWRLLPESPLSARAPFFAWTGHELVVVGTAIRVGPPPTDGAAYDPASGTWRSLPPAPIELTDATSVWSGRELIVFGAALHGGNVPETETAIGAAYDPALGSWRRLPDSSLSPQASTAVWNGRRLVAWDYLNQSQTYDPEIDTWSPVQRVPLDDGECSPRSVAVGPSVFGEYCGAMTVYEGEADRWVIVTLPHGSGPVSALVSAPPVALIIGRDQGTGSAMTLAYRPAAAQPPPGTVETTITTIDGISVSPNAVAVGEGGVWVVTATERPDEGDVVRLDPQTGEVLARIPLQALPGWEFGGAGIAVGEGSVWISGYRSVPEECCQVIVQRIDPATNALSDVIDAGRGFESDVWVDETGIWVLMFSGGSSKDRMIVSRVDPSSQEVVARIPIEATWSQTIFSAGGSVWVAGTAPHDRGPVNPSTLYRIDPATNTVVDVLNLGAYGVSVTAPAEDAVWLWIKNGPHRFDARTMAFSGLAVAVPVAVPEGCCQGPFVSDGAGGLWVAHPVLGENRGVWHVTPDGVIDAHGAISGPRDPWLGIAYAYDAARRAIWVVHYQEAVSRIQLQLAG